MMKLQSKWSRREFFATVVGTGVLAIIHPIPAQAIEQVDPRVAMIVSTTIGIDAHNHIDVPVTAGEVPGPTIDLAGDMKRSGFSAICMTFSVDRPEIRNPAEGYDRFINALKSMDQQLIANGVKRSLNMADLRAAHMKRQPTVIQSVEGGHFLEGHLERLGEAYDRGLRHLTLLHDNDASVPLGDVFTNPSRWGGLTKFGADVIKECNRLGILVDLGHASADTVTAALKLTTVPVIISHTSLDTQLGNNPSMASRMRPRLISKEQAKIVSEAGGVIGVWTHLTDTPVEYAQNVRALVDVVGIDHVCIGTDTKLTSSYKPAGSPAAGQNGERIGERTNLVWADQKIGFYFAIVDAMLKIGFTADEIGKVGSGNFCRVFDAATKGRAVQKN